MTSNQPYSCAPPPKTSPTLGPFRVERGTRIYAIGDIHGRLDLLQRLLKTIAKDSTSPPSHCILVCLGDYIDRGPHSAGVVACLLSLESDPVFKGFDRHFLKGNHEQMMAEFLEGKGVGALWLKNGGAATLESYGIKNPWGDLKQVRHQAQAALPVAHRHFFDHLELHHHQGDYHFVHAGVRPHVPLEHQSPDDVLWIRNEFLTATEDFGAMIVHGHSPVDVPNVLPNRIAIDTRAWASGTLTCLVVQEDTLRFLST